MTVRDVALSRWLLSSLLIAGAGLFAAGVAAERHAADHHDAGSSTHIEAGGEVNESGVEKPAQSESSAETVLGANVESTGIVIVVAALSVALAFVTWRTKARPLLLATALFAAVFAALDVVELLHQLRESRTAIAVLAAVIAAAHIAAATTAVQRAPRTH